MASIDSVASVPLGRRFVEFGRRQALRWQVLVTRWELDRELAEGIDSDSTPALALRSTQLLRPRRRRALARAVERVVIDADRDPHRAPAVPWRAMRSPRRVTRCSRLPRYFVRRQASNHVVWRCYGFCSVTGTRRSTYRQFAAL